MGRFSTLLAMAVALVMMALVQGSMATTWMVGGPLGWSTRALSYGSHSKTFYQDWVQSNFPYCNNDIFVFDYPIGESVMVVSKGAYDACDISHPINHSDGGESWSFKVFGNWQWYFISGVPGHCATGMKMTVWVNKFC